MKKSLLLFFLLLTTFYNARSQNFYYGNEWINYSQTYFKFKIVNNGFYRIPYQTLVNSGVPVSGINGSNFAIFNKGHEIPIYVTTNSILGQTDYIEFYAVRNDGVWDSTLYADKSWQGNDHISLFNDSAAYFLTWLSQPSTNHFVPATNNIISHPPKEPYCWYTVPYVGGTVRSSYYNLSRGEYALSGQSFYDSDFSNTEGYADNYVNKAAKDYIMNTPFPYASGPSCTFK